MDEKIRLSKDAHSIREKSTKGELGHVSPRNRARFLTSEYEPYAIVEWRGLSMRRRLAFYEVCFGRRAQRLKAALLLSRDALPPSTVQASSASSFNAKLGVQEIKQVIFPCKPRLLHIPVLGNCRKPDEESSYYHYPILSSTSA